MQLLSIVGLAIVAAVLCTVLRHCYPEYAAAVTILTGVTILLLVCGALTPLFDFLKQLSETAGLQPEYAALAVKLIGLCWVTALGSDICRDTGQTALASKVELAGRLAVLLAALPAFEKLFSLAGELIGGGT